jgi:hypothetical protein
MQVSTKINLEGTGMRNNRRVLAALIVAAIGIPGLAAAGTDIFSDVAPPPQKTERAPPPRDGYVWGTGYWELSGHAYYWVPGRWVVERRNAHWIADHWEQAGSQWHYLPGHWER